MSELYPFQTDQGALVRPERTNIVGVGISAVNMDQAVAQINRWIDARQRIYVTACSVHGVIECRKNPLFRRAVNDAGMATPDGMPLVWLSRWYGHKNVSRVYGPDLMLALCQATLKTGYSHYFYGGAPGVAEQLSANLQQRFPGLRVAGLYSPPYRLLTEEEQQQVAERINNAAPDIVWVGLGCPKQDLWMAANRGRLQAPVLIGVGAAFDFHAGRLTQAPVWVQRSGLEWLYRLLQEPGRLWQRYLGIIPRFVLLALAQALKLRRFDID